MVCEIDEREGRHFIAMEFLDTLAGKPARQAMTAPEAGYR
jgi:hypothetical protein